MSALASETELARDLASECGALALAWQRGGEAGLAVEHKRDGDGPVTNADLAVNRRLVEALRARFPADGILAEESAEPSERLTRERCWFIDPIDGTRDFIAGDPHWAIHIGLCVGGRPVFGLVAEPARARTSWGVCVGDLREAWCDDGGGLRRLAPPGGARRLVSSRSHHSERVLAVAAALGIAPAQHHRFGSVGCKAAALARDEADIYAHPIPGTKLWDTCAPHALLLGCGGEMSDLRGIPLRYDAPDIEHRHGLLATVGDHHAATVAALAPLAREWFSE